MKPNVAIIVSGGVVQDVVSDTDVGVTIIDQDIEGTDETVPVDVDGLDDPARVGNMTPDIDPEFMKQFAGDEEVEPGLVREGKDADYVMPEGMDSCWITVGGISVYVVRKDGGVMVEAYPLEGEADDSIASMEAYSSAGVAA